MILLSKPTVAVIISVLAILSSLASGNAVGNQFDIRNERCSKVGSLYAQILPNKRIGELTPVDSAALSSKHYCLVYMPTLAYLDSSAKATDIQVRNIITRYNTLWSYLNTDSEKIAFAHLFLKRLSTKTSVLPKTGIENEINIIIVGKNNKGSQVFLTHNLSVNIDDYLAVEQGLEYLSLMPDDTEFLAPTSKVRKWVKWAIKGKGKPDIFTQSNNSLLPNGGSPYCIECMVYTIDQIIGSGGGGYGGTYNWRHYAEYGRYDELEEGKKAEQQQCAIHNDCKADTYITISKDGVGESCVYVEYSNGTKITGLYCEVYP